MPTKVPIKGTIVPNNDKAIYEWYGMEATCPRDVNKIIESAKGDSLEVEINSPGGEIYSGVEIYTALKSYESQVTTKVVGIAASAASVIAMAGNKVMMSPSSQLMVHNVWSIVVGDYHVMDKMSDELKNVNKAIANSYRLKTGLSEKEVLDMMDEETYLNAKEAIELNFADEIMFDNSKQLVASAKHGKVLPLEVIEKARELIASEKKNNTNKELELAKAKIKLLKLKGEMCNDL